MADERIKCPFCGEQISASAVKCRFCKEWIREPNQLPSVRKQGSSGARAVSKGIKEKNYSKMAFKFKFFLLIGVLLGLTLIVLKIIDGPYGGHLNDEHTARLASYLLIPMWIIGLAVGIWGFTRSYYKE